MSHLRNLALATPLWLALLATPAAAQNLGRYVQLGPMPFPNAEAGAAVLDGRVYLAGGFSAEEALMIYDLATDSWDRGPDIPQPVHHPAVAAVDGRIYVIGGHSAEEKVQIYDPATRSWSAGAENPTPRRAMGVVTLDGRIHLIGGTDGDTGGGGLSAHGAYDPATDSWEVLAPLLEPREHGYAAVIDGEIYYAAGRLNFVPKDDLQIYDPATDTWTFGPPLPESVSGHAVQVVDGLLYAIGGEDPAKLTVTRSNQRFHPGTGEWERMLDLPRPLHAAPNVVHMGSIYLFGGVHAVEGSSQGIDQVLRYDPPPSRNPAPRKLKAKVLDASSVRLKWRFKRRQSDATSLRIQVRVEEGDWQSAATVAKGVRRTVLRGLEPGATYSFRVRAEGPPGPSDWSNVRTVTLPE